MGLDDFAPGIEAYYEGCTTMAEIAQKAAAMEGGDFVVSTWKAEIQTE